MEISVREVSRPPADPRAARDARLLGAVGEAFILSNGPIHDWCEDGESFFVLQGSELIRYEKRSGLLTGRADGPSSAGKSDWTTPRPLLFTHPSWGDTLVVAVGGALFARSRRTLQPLGAKAGPLCSAPAQVGDVIFFPVPTNDCDPDLLKNQGYENFVLVFDPRTFEFGRAFSLGLEAPGGAGPEPLFRAPVVATLADGDRFWVFAYDRKAAPASPDFVKVFAADGRVLAEARGEIARAAAAQGVKLSDLVNDLTLKFYVSGPARAVGVVSGPTAERKEGQQPPKAVEFRLLGPGSPARKIAGAKSPAKAAPKPAQGKKSPAKKSPAKLARAAVEVAALDAVARDVRVGRIMPRGPAGRVVRRVL